jgi:hypothetical protein
MQQGFILRVFPHNPSTRDMLKRLKCANSGRYRTAAADGLKWTYSGFCESHLGRRHPVRPIIHASQIRQVFNQRRRARSTREPHSAARATRLYDAGFTM